MRHIARLAAAISISTCLVLAASTAWAGPLDLYGFGPRAIGMGGAFTGLADDYSAVFYNPAGMAWSEGNNMTAGFFSASTHFTLDLEPAPGTTKALAHRLEALEREKTDIEPVNAYFVGFTSRLNRYFSMGILAFMPLDYVIRLYPVDSHFPSFIMYENRAKRIQTYAGISFMPVSGFALGGGVSIFADCKGKFDIPIEIKNQDATHLGENTGQTQPLDIDSSLQLDFPFRFTPYASVMARPWEWLRLGASYRGSFQWDVTIDVDASLTVENYVLDLSQLEKIMPGVFPLKGVVELQAPALGDRPIRVPLELEGLDGLVSINASLPVRVLADMSDHWKPQDIAFGASFKVTDAWLIGTDVTWYDWSAYPAPDLRLTIEDWNIRLSTLPTAIRARVRTLSVPVLGTIGPLPPVQVSLPGLQTRIKVRFPTRTVVKPKTHDIFVPKIGVEHRLQPIINAPWFGDVQPALRAGYSYQQSPFEQQRGYVNLVDADKHVMSLGAGVTFNHKLSVDAYGQCHYLIPVRFEKDLVDPDMPFDAVEARGYALAGGVSASYRW